MIELTIQVVCVKTEMLTEPYMKIWTGQTCNTVKSSEGAGLGMKIKKSIKSRIQKQILHHIYRDKVGNE